MADENPFAKYCGWLDDPHRHELAGTLPTLAQAGPLLRADPTRNCLLYKCFTDVFASYPDYQAQQIGDCVGFGHARAHDLLQTIDTYLGGRPAETIRRTSTEFIYATSRQVAGILGNRDGSYGSAAVKAMTNIGMVPLGSVGEAYDGARAKAWGRNGAPSWLMAEAAAWKLGSAVLLHSAEDMLAALQDGHPATICSIRGFTTERDKHGFCKVHGRWGHCMWVAGYRAKPKGFCICQSWGPHNPTGPTDLDQPSWSFWCHYADMEHIIAEGDSYSLSDSPTFEPQALPASWAA